jgi:hypothetical protein
MLVLKMRTYLTLAIIFAIAGSMLLSNNLAMALSNDARYNSGYDHGCSDGKQGGHYYLSGNRGAAYHTSIFMQGYNDGYAACSSSSSSSPSPIQTSPNPTRGQIWMELCTQVKDALYNPCDSYVNADGSLTSSGQDAVGGIRNGLLLSGFGIGYLHLPPGLTAEALKFLAPLTGCGNIVNIDFVKNIVNLNGIGDIASLLNNLM